MQGFPIFWIYYYKTEDSNRKLCITIKHFHYEEYKTTFIDRRLPLSPLFISVMLEG